MKNALVSFWALPLFLAATLNAQTTGDVKGIVADPSGGAVGQARLPLRSNETGQSRTQKTDSEGRFAFDQLRGGDYTLQAEAAGFRPASTAAHVRTGETADITFRLELGAVTGTVIVWA